MAQHVDVDELRDRLNLYQSALESHTAELRNDFHELNLTWQALESCYGGSSAEEFHRAWSETAEWFGDYVERTTALAADLEERINELAHL